LASRVLLLAADGQTADVIVRRLEARGLTVSVAREAAAALQRLGEHQLIILDALDGPSLAMLCRRINDEAGSKHPPILAVAHSPEVDARVQLLEAGADDVIVRPIDPRELEALVEALLLRAPASARSDGGQTPVTPRPDSAPGRVIAFSSAKGGSGTTTLAVNTALILAEKTPGSVAIADFDMYHGQVATHLDIYPRSSTAALAREDRDELNPEVFQEAGRQHAGGLTAFGGPYRPDDALDITGSQLISLVEQMRALYSVLIIDAGNVLDVRTLELLDQVDALALVITPDIPSLRLLHAWLQVLSESGSAADRSLFVVNQIYPRPMIDGDQIEEHLGIKIAHEIPNDGEGFLKSVNEGQPLVTTAHRSAASVALRRLAAVLTNTEVEAVAAQPRQKGRFRGLLGRV
jgi:pilus assembly protein CpaE